MVGAPPPRPRGYTFGSNVPPFGGFGTGSSNKVKSLDPKNISHLERKQRRTYVNIVSKLVMTMITFALLNELLFWMRCHQSRLETREAMDRLIEVLETQDNEHLYSTVL